MLAQRVASAAVGLPIVVVLIWAGGPWYTAAACLVILVAANEFQAALRGRWTPMGVLAAGLATALPAGAFVGLDWVLWFALAGVLIPLVLLTLLATPAAALNDWLASMGGLAYVGLLGAHLVLLRELSQGMDLVYLAMIGTFAVDTFAYAVGRAIGRRKLAPHISPSKTVEGTLGGLAGGFGMVVLLNYFLGLRLEAALILPLAALLPLAAVLGDLVESMLKRGMEVKDAGNVIPGHGGMLDRLDSLLFTFPVVYYYVIWVVP